jgi:hypothetical protein
MKYTILSATVLAAVLSGCSNLPDATCQVRGSSGAGVLESVGRGVSGNFCIFSLVGDCDIDWYIKMENEDRAICEAGNMTPGAAHAIRRVRDLDPR